MQEGVRTAECVPWSILKGLWLGEPSYSKQLAREAGIKVGGTRGCTRLGKPIDKTTANGVKSKDGCMHHTLMYKRGIQIVESFEASPNSRMGTIGKYVVAIVRCSDLC